MFAHGGTLSGSGSQHAYSDIALATRRGSGEDLKHMSWRPLRHSTAQRWRLCEQEQNNAEAVSCTSCAALVNHSYTTELVLLVQITAPSDGGPVVVIVPSISCLHCTDTTYLCVKTAVLCRVLLHTLHVPGCVGKCY